MSFYKKKHNTKRDTLCDLSKNNTIKYIWLNEILFNIKGDNTNCSLTLTSMSPILFTARIMGRPTIDGNMCAGKFDAAYPHLTNYNYKTYLKC